MCPDNRTLAPPRCGPSLADDHHGMHGIVGLCRRLERRHRVERVGARVLPLASWCGLSGATALAVVRLAVPEAGWLTPAIATTAALLPLTVLPRALALRTPAWRLAGEADRLAAADGLLMALAASPQADPAWYAQLAPRLAAVRMPRLRLAGLPTALAAGALLIGAWFLPQVTTPPAAPPVAEGSLASATAKLEQLREQQLAAPDAIETLAERLAAVREALATQGLDQQTWAALDALERDLAATRAQATDRLADALAKAGALAGLSGQGEAAAAAASDLALALAELNANAPGLAVKLPAGAEGEALLRLAQQAMAGGELTEAQRQALQRWGLDPAKAPGDGAQPGDAEAAKRLAGRLAGELAQAAGMNGPASEEGEGPSGTPGPGGGHPELTWGDAKRVESGFRDRLESGTPRHPETGAPISTQARAPRPDEQVTAPPGAAPLVGHAAGAAGTHSATVAPRHRAAVAGYFAAGAAP